MIINKTYYSFSIKAKIKIEKVKGIPISITKIINILLV